MKLSYAILDTYSERCQTNKMRTFVKLINGFYSLTIFPKSSTFLQGSEIRLRMRQHSYRIENSYLAHFPAQAQIIKTNPDRKKFLIFLEMELSSSHMKRILIFSHGKSFPIFSQKKAFLIFPRMKACTFWPQPSTFFPKRISYIFS